MTTLSTRISTGPITPQLVEEIAIARGWQHHPNSEHWRWARRVDGIIKRQYDCPDYTADIRLTLADARREGLFMSIEQFPWGVTARVYESGMGQRAREDRKDDKDTLAAITALLRTTEKEG